MHKSIGVFRYALTLEDMGIYGPSRQLATISAFVEDVLGRTSHLPNPDDEHALMKWVREGLQRIAQPPIYFSDGIDPSVTRLAVRTQAYVAWDLYHDFAELLNARCGAEAYASACRRLRVKGFHIGTDELVDITGVFVTVSLPRAVRTFRLLLGLDKEEAWLARVFYRYALHTALTDRANHQHLVALHSSSSFPRFDSVAERAGDVVETKLLDALESLGDVERTAIELYFGFSGREQTFSAIAATLNTSEYLARSSVVRGLATIAANLGERGELAPREFELSQRIFGKGMPIEAAATDLGLSRHEARRVAADIGRKFRRSLRARTTSAPPLERVPPQRKDAAMAPTTELSEMSPERIVDDLLKLKGTPKLDHDNSGIAYAYLSSRLPLARIREVALSAQYRKQLERSGVSLDWLAVPDATLDRADVDPRYLEWAEQLRQLGQRSWQVSEWLYELCVDCLGKKSLPIPSEQPTEITQRIHRVLTGTARTLEGTLSRELRTAPNPRLRIDWTGESALARWENARDNVQFALVRDVIQPRCLELPDLPHSIAEVLPSILEEGIRAGDVRLPGFLRTEESTEVTVWLEWMRPVFSERAKA